MALTTRSIFGIHQFSPYSLTSGEFYGTIKCLSGSSMELSGETVKLEGGSSKFPFASESGKISSSLKLKVKEYPAFLFELCFGKAPTETTTPSSGEVVGLADVVGDSITDAISAIAVTASQSAKFGKYVLKAVDSDTLAVYCSTDIDFGKGTAVAYEDDTLKIAEVTIASGANVISALGLTITSGSPSFTADDTAVFEVLPAHTSKLEVVVGHPSDVTPEFGALVMAEKRGDGSIFAVDCFRVKAAAGMGIGFEESAFSESEITLDALYSAEKGGVFKVISLK